MKKYYINFYSNSGFMLGESAKEYKDFLEAEEYVKDIIQNHSSVKITSENSVEFIRVSEIAKVTITE